MSSYYLILTVSLISFGPLIADEWPHYLGPQHDLTWREDNVLDSFPDEGLPLVWSTKIGAGYGGPSVANDCVFVMDRIAEAAKQKTEGNPNFFRIQIPGIERIQCLDANSGKILWAHSWRCEYTTAIPYANGPRCTPTVDGEWVIALGAEGHLWCLEAATGEVVWSKNFKKMYGLEAPTWGWSAHPLVDGDQVICIVGGEGTAVISYDKKTGTERWRSLSSKEPGYCPPVIEEYRGKRRLLIWHGEQIASLDPDTGNSYWTVPFKATYGMAIAAPRLAGDSLFVMCYNGISVMLNLDPDGHRASVAWRGDFKQGLGGVMNTPFIEDGHVYGCGRRGNFRCVDLATGNRLWSTTAPALKLGDQDKKPTRWANVFVVPHEPSGNSFLINDLGELILAKLSKDGYQELDRTSILKPDQLVGKDQLVWSHPAFANRRIYCRNDCEIRCLSLAR
jgi:outer membrane protein assembly factor BamB